MILDYLSLYYKEILHNETEFETHSIKRRELESLHHEARALRDLDNLLVASPEIETEGSADNFESIGVDFIPDMFFDSSSSSSDFSFYDDVSSSDSFSSAKAEEVTFCLESTFFESHDFAGTFLHI